MSAWKLFVSAALLATICAGASSQPKPIVTPLVPGADPALPRGTVPSTGSIPEVPRLPVPTPALPLTVPKTDAVPVPIPKLAPALEPLPEPARPAAPSKPLIPRLDFTPLVPPVPAPTVDFHGPLVQNPRQDFYPPPEVPTPVEFKKPPAPAEKSVDDLLNELERVQAQKAELEKKEQELKALIRKKLEAQSERLKKLGVAPKDAKDAKEPDRVGRIIIEGNTRTSDAQILKLLNLRPGQLLRYPALEESRKNLETAGFRGVYVEVVPNELDSAVKDIRVKVDEPELKPKPAQVPLPTTPG